MLWRASHRISCSEMKAAFTSIKEALCNVATLAHLDQTAEIFLAVDASDIHLGAVLQQQARGAAHSHLVSSQRSYRSCTTEILWFRQRAILHGVLSGSEAFPPPPGRAEVLYRDGSQTSHFRPTQRFRTMVSQPNKRAVIPSRVSSWSEGDAVAHCRDLTAHCGDVTATKY